MNIIPPKLATTDFYTSIRQINFIINVAHILYTGVTRVCFMDFEFILEFWCLWNPWSQYYPSTMKATLNLDVWLENLASPFRMFWLGKTTVFSWLGHLIRLSYFIRWFSFLNMTEEIKRILGLRGRQIIYNMLLHSTYEWCYNYKGWSFQEGWVCWVCWVQVLLWKVCACVDFKFSSKF